MILKIKISTFGINLLGLRFYLTAKKIWGWCRWIIFLMTRRIQGFPKPWTFQLKILIGASSKSTSASCSSSLSFTWEFAWEELNWFQLCSCLIGLTNFFLLLSGLGQVFSLLSLFFINWPINTCFFWFLACNFHLLFLGLVSSLFGPLSTSCSIDLFYSTFIFLEISASFEISSNFCFLPVNSWF